MEKSYKNRMFDDLQTKQTLSSGLEELAVKIVYLQQ